MQQLEADLCTHAEPVPELDVEVCERLEQPGVLQRTRVDGIESDAPRELDDLLPGGLVIACDERGESLVSELASSPYAARRLC